MGARARRLAVWLTGGALFSQLPLYCFLLVGDMAWSLKERAVSELAKAQLREFSQDPVLLNVLFGVAPAIIGFLWAPTIGAWSDRTRTTSGRRIPFLIAFAPLLAASLILLALAEPLADFMLRLAGSDPSQRTEAVVACMAVAWVLFEVFSLASNALFIALINDTVPHHVLGRFFGCFRIVSLAVGASFFYFVFDEDLPAKAGQVMRFIALAYLGCFAVLCVFVREPTYPPPPVMPRPLLRRLRAERGDFSWFFVMLFLAVGIATVCLQPINVNAYNAMLQFGVDRSSFGRALALTYCISILLAWPLGWLADHVHPLRIGFVTLALYAFCMLCAWIFVGGRNSFLFWFVLHGVLAGAFLTGTASLLPLLLPRERFSELAAFSASITAVLAIAVGLGTGMLIDWQGRDFRMIFLASGLAAALGAAAWFHVMRRQQQLARTG